MFWVKQITKNVAPVLLIAAFLLSNIIPFFGFTPRAQAVSYDFFQTDWSGGTSISSAALSGWTKYTSASAGGASFAALNTTAVDATGGTKLTLATGTDTRTVLSNDLTPNGPKGETFTAGVLTQTDFQPIGKMVSNGATTSTSQIVNGPGATFNAPFCLYVSSQSFNLSTTVPLNAVYISYSAPITECANRAPCSAAVTGVNISGTKLSYTLTIYQNTGCWAYASVASVVFTVSVPHWNDGSLTLGPYTIAKPAGAGVFKDFKVNYVPGQGTGVAVEFVNKTDSTGTLSYTLKFTNPTTVAAQIQSIDFNFYSNVTTKTTAEYQVPVALGLSIQGTPTIIYQQQPVGASVAFAPGYPVISNGVLKYKLVFTNPIDQALTTDSVVFTLAGTPPISGTLISSIVNMSDASSIFYKLKWNERTPSGTTVKFQVRTSTNGSTWSNWMGPDGNAATYFSKTDGSCISAANQGDATITSVTCSVPQLVAQAAGAATQYFQYQIFLDSPISTATPEVFDVAASYVINTAPTVSSVAASQNTNAVAIGYSIADLEQSSFAVDLFYDVGLTLDSALSLASGESDKIILAFPSGADLSSLLPPDGVLLIGSEEISYAYRGANYVSGLSSLSGPPLTRGYGPLVGGKQYSTTRSAHVIGDKVYIQARTLSGDTGQISCSAGTSCAKLLLWDAKQDIADIYKPNQQVVIVANDGEVNRQLGVSAPSSPFALDAKKPDLGASPLAVSLEAGIISVDMGNYKGYKTNVPSVLFTVGVPAGAGVTDNPVADDRMTFCNGAACGSPSAAALLAGTAPGWTAPPLPSWTTPYAYGSAQGFSTNQSAIQSINFIALDIMGNMTAPVQQRIVYDATPPPLPTNFIAGDISASLGRPAIYLKWDYSAVWTAAQKDAFGREDFAGYMLYRHDSATTVCSGGEGVVASGSLFCPISTLPDRGSLGFTDEGVQDGKTYIYRIITRDDLGNQWEVADTAVLQSVPIKVLVEGAPKITPQITWLKTVPQDAYTDPVMIYWETRNTTGEALPSDSQIAYVRSTTLPNDFTNAPTQGNTALASIGNIDQSGNCACHKVQLNVNGLEPGKYYFEMRSLYGSETGKLSGESFWFEVKAAPPKIKATITNVQPADGALSSNPTGITISWDTVDAAGIPMDTNGYVDYWGPGESAAHSVGSETGAKHHEVDLTGLAQNTTYTYQVRSMPTVENADKTIFPASGTRSFATKAITEDKEPPNMTSVAVCDNKGTSARICWDTLNEPNGASSAVEIWTGPDDHMVRQNVGQNVADGHYVQLTNLKPLTSYFYKAISYDNAAPPNRGESADLTFDTVAAIDIPVPAISNLRHDSPSANSVVIYWDTVSAADSAKLVDTDSTVFIGTGPTSFELPPVSSSLLASSHVITVTGLKEGTQYYFKVQSANANGVATPDDAAAKTCKNRDGSTEVCSFITPVSPEDAPVIATSGQDAIQVTVQTDPVTLANTATITWHTDKLGNSLVEFGGAFKTNADGTKAPEYERGFVGNVNDNQTTHVVQLPKDLTEGAEYHFRVRTVDRFKQIIQHPNGNATSVDNPNDAYPPCDKEPETNPNRYNCLDPTFKVAPSLYTQSLEVKDPLEITGVGTLLVTDATVVIGWTTNRAADSEVYYGESAAYGCLGGTCPVGDKYKTVGMDGKPITNISALTRTHAATITGLQPNKKYYYKVVSTDIADVSKAADNDGQGFTFTTAEGTKAISQEEYDKKVNDLEALKLEEQKLRDELAKAGLSSAERASLENQLAANLARQKELQEALQQQLTVDRTPPTITNVAVSEITEDSAAITWDTNEDASSNVFYGETAEYSQLAGKGSSYFKKHSVMLSDLNPGMLYHFSAVSYDTSANRAQSEDAMFTTKGIKGEKQETIKEELGESTAERIKKLPPSVRLSLDKITMLLKEFSEDEVARILNEAGLQLVSPPKFTAGEPMVKVAETTVTISWQTNKNSDSRVAYKEHAAYDEKKENPYGSEVGDTDVFTQDHEVTIENLQPGTLYHYQLRSREQAGRSAKSIDRTFRTKPITPEATAIIVADRTEHTATIKWKTNIPTKASVEYKNLRTEQERSQGDPQFTTMHELTLIELDPDTKYEAVIRSENELEVSAVSKKFSFTTKKDITPPEVSQVRTELSLIPGKSDVVQAVISWRTNEQTTGKVLYDEGLQKDRELRQSTAVGEDLAATHVMVLNKLRPLTIYTFKIVSQDTAGNIGTSKEFKIITPRKEQSVLELIISNFENIFGFLREL